MESWVRSLSLLGLGFAGVVVVTLALAAVIVPDAAGVGVAPAAPASSEPLAPNPPAGRAPGGPVTTVGGALEVTGDREGTFILDREATDQGYALAGDEGRIFFGGEPLDVERISYDRLEIYLDPGDCVLTPGERHDSTGIAGLHLRCEDVEDIRGGGVVTMDGTVGVSADLLGLRGDLPPTGGTVQVGDDDLSFPLAVLFTGSNAFVPGGGFLATDDGQAALRFDYDVHSHDLRLVAVEVGGRTVGAELGPDACTLTTRVLGRLNPRTETAEVTIECPSVELSDGEVVRISGTIVADLVEPSP